jgi:hypothetical protein
MRRTSDLTFRIRPIEVPPKGPHARSRGATQLLSGCFRFFEFIVYRVHRFFIFIVKQQVSVKRTRVNTYQATR